MQEDRFTPAGIVLGLLGIGMASWLYFSVKSSNEDTGLYCRVYDKSSPECFSLTKPKGWFDQQDQWIVQKNNRPYALSEIKLGTFFIGRSHQVSQKNIPWTEQDLNEELSNSDNQADSLDAGSAHSSQMIFCQNPKTHCKETE